MIQRAEIHLTAPGHGTIELDGVDVPGLVGFTVESTVSSLTKLTLTLNVLTLELDDNTAEVVIAEDVAKVLTEHGWTPPSAE
jgi:hypothetical protein